MCNQASHTHQTPRGAAAAAARRQARTADRADDALSPTFRLIGGEIPTVPAGLKALTAHRTEVEQAARSVGRIHQGPVTLGTGFIIGPNVIMTARHVAQSFAGDVDGVLKIRIGWTPAIDFVAEEPPPSPVPDSADETSPHGDTSKAMMTGRSKSAFDAPAELMPAKHVDDFHQQPENVPPACYPIRSVLYDNEELDIALLLVPFASAGTHAAREADGEPRFQPLTLTSTAPSADRRDVCIIGCPDQDPFATDFERNSIFNGEFDVKRVQPGVINRVLLDDAMLGHTCSTLRGNSGSPVIDLETGQVIGLHRRGSREQPGEPAMNEATALWLLPKEVQDVLRKARDLYAPKQEPLATSEAVAVRIGAREVTAAHASRKHAAAERARRSRSPRRN